MSRRTGWQALISSLRSIHCVHAVVWHTGLPVFEADTLCCPTAFPLCPGGPVSQFCSCLPGNMAPFISSLLLQSLGQPHLIKSLRPGTVTLRTARIRFETKGGQKNQQCQRRGKTLEVEVLRFSVLAHIWSKQMSDPNHAGCGEDQGCSTWLAWVQMALS